MLRKLTMNISSIGQLSESTTERRMNFTLSVADMSHYITVVVHTYWLMHLLMNATFAQLVTCIRNARALKKSRGGEERVTLHYHCSNSRIFRVYYK